MLGKTHQIGGITAGIAVGAVALRIPMEAQFIGVFATLLVSSSIGGLFPDIDQRNSKIGRSLWPVSMVTHKTFKHRGLTHSLAFNILVPFLILLFYPVIPHEWRELFIVAIIGFTAGYASHLFLDSFTNSGVPLLLPFKKTRFNLGKFRTGKIDSLAQVLLVTLSVAIFYYFYLKH